MNPDEFKKQLKKEAPDVGPKVHIVDCDQGVKVVDIIRMEQEIREYPDKDGKMKPKKRFLLTVRGVELPIIMPYSVATQLKNLMETKNVVSFTVARTGNGIMTRYQLVPVVAP